MPALTDKQGVQRILDMVNCLQKFAPNLADSVKPLRELFKKENEFVWEQKVHGKYTISSKFFSESLKVLISRVVISGATGTLGARREAHLYLYKMEWGLKWFSHNHFAEKYLKYAQK